MEGFFGEFLKYTTPAFIVFLTAFFTLRHFFKSQEKERKLRVFLDNQKSITPIRLQAYERMILFLERLTMESLIMRLNVMDKNAKELQTDLLKIIRAEFEHNLTQQIYISPTAWKLVKSSKENTVKLINTTSMELSPNAPGIKLSTALLEKQMELDKLPTEDALNFIKEEVKQLFYK